jgi:hypothetical protein
MNQRIKLIWDFRGPDAMETAKHHTVHLKEFAAMESLSYHEVDIKELNPMLSSASIIVDKKDMITYRDALKPHRGELA